MGLGRNVWIAAGVAADGAYAVSRHVAALAARRRREAPPAVVRTTPLPPSAGRPPAVVLLPGITEPPGFMRPLAGWLRARGHEVVEVEELGWWNLRPIPEAAALVRGHLGRLGLSRVIVVAHSKGGLIGKALMRESPGLVAGMVAVATPFDGHRFTPILVTPALRVFRTTDPVLRALTAERAVNAAIVSIVPDVDPIVLGAAHLAGARNIRLPVVGHFRILSHPLFLACLEEILASAPFAAESLSRPGTVVDH